MGLKLCLVLFLLAMAAVPHSSSSSPVDASPGWGRFHVSDSGVGEFMGDEKAELLGNPMVAPARLLAQKKFLSYAALKKNSVPCGQRGTSYYNCRQRQKANPYRRGCSVITRCARFTD